MSGIDRADYDGLVKVPFDNYEFRILHGDGRTEIVVFGCDCSAVMADDEARQVHAALTKYLRDRELADAQSTFLNEVAQ
jgi:hypothetical protein